MPNILVRGLGLTYFTDWDFAKDARYLSIEAEIHPLRHRGREEVVTSRKRPSKRRPLALLVRRELLCEGGGEASGSNYQPPEVNYIEDFAKFVFLCIRNPESLIIILQQGSIVQFVRDEGSRFRASHLSGSEAGSYLRPIDFFITQR